MKSSDILNLIIIIISVIIIIFLYTATILNQKKARKLKFKCSKCGHTFKPFFLQLYLTYSVMAPLRYIFSARFKEKFFLKCPQCRKFSWCSIIEEADLPNRF